jgi:hypothetical protein
VTRQAARIAGRIRLIDLEGRHSNSAQHALAAANRGVSTHGYRFSAIRTTPTATFTAEFSESSPMRRAMFVFDVQGI